MADDSFYEFCGNSSIFDKSLLLDSEWPAFTSCFQNSLLVWVPCGWLWLTLPAYLPYLLRLHSGVRIEVNSLNTLKSLLCVLLAVLATIQLFRAEDDEADSGKNVAAVVYVSGGLKLATFLLAGGLVQLERVKGVVTSGVLWMFWFFLALAGVIPFYTKIYQQEYDKSVFVFAAFYVYFALVLLQLLLHSFADKLSRHGYQLLGEKPSPESLASFPSRVVFWWISGLIIRAYRHGLSKDDLFDLHPRDQSARVVPEFQEAWEREVRRADKRNRARDRRQQKNVYVWYRKDDRDSQHAQFQEPGETTSLLASDRNVANGAVRGDNPVEKKHENVQASLFRVLARTYGLDLLKSFAAKFVYDLLQFVGPQLLDVLIAYTNDKGHEKVWKGYVYACAMFVVAVTASVFFHQQFHISMTLGMRIKSAVISALYKKALTLSNEARKGSTVGEIVNLMSVDCQRLQDVTGYLWTIWSAPLQIGLALALLWGQLGVSVLAGVTIMVLLIPVNAVVAVKTRRYQMEQMKLKDARLKMMNEVLAGIKVLKLYAWEKSFEEKVSDIRNKELQVLKKSAYLNAFSTFVWTCAPFLVTLATFATYVLTSDDHYLDAQKAFVSLSLFNILRFPINLLPMIITYIAQAQVSIARIGNFLRNPDLDSSNVQYDTNAGEAVAIEKGTFTWDRQLAIPTLRNVTLKVQRGQLVAVVGQVGVGKSSLLSAMLGEMEKLSGHVVVQSNVAYVPQQAWIQNATLRDNVLFGSPYRDDQYNKVLDACALRPDLDILPGGDLTEIGEKGINLSGGQKQRVSLARAVYSEADIYLLDDPLSAVDSHVGKHIFHQVIGSKGLLRAKTRVLVTHGVHWLPLVDVIVVMVDGVISEMGSYDQLLAHDGQFAQFLKTYLTHADDSDDDDPEIQAMKAKILERVDSVTSDTAATSGDEKVLQRRAGLSRQSSHAPSEKDKDKGDKPTEKNKAPAGKDKIIEEERSERGRVKWAVFMNYFRAIGLGVTALVMLLFAGYQSASLYSSIWLADWTDDSLLANARLRNTSDYQDRNYMYLGVYGALGVGQAVLVLGYSVLASISMVTAAGNLHWRMLAHILRAPMSFFDTTPSGRIVNRFSSDVAVVDNTLPATLRMVILQVFSVIGTFIVISYSTPIFLSVVLPLGVLYYLVQRFYIPTSRELKRIESTTRSPIFNHFSETITGAASIRAYKAQGRFINDNSSKVDTNLVFYFAGIASNRWLGFRLEFLGNLVILAAAMFAVMTPDLNGGLVGLSVSYAMQVTASLNWMVRMISDLETNVVSVERLKEYSETPTEADWVVPGKRPAHQWPDRGSVQFVGYSTRYRPGLELVLRDLTIDIEGGQMVGIVGRTGAGKSSMTVALFRLIEAASGSIVIDDQVAGDIGLHDLRSRLTILPQDPVLFSGSLRMNLDPFDQYSDEQVWQALEHAHLKKFVSETDAGLLYECGEGGSNLSVGQRQLVCLARCLLRKTKILVLDEATAAVDMETDRLIQETIRCEFRDCTVLTIAHRLNTILDYDRILVMDQGVVKEYGSPSALLQDRNSVFYGMARDANLV